MAPIEMLARLGEIDQAFKQANMSFARLGEVNPEILFHQDNKCAQIPASWRLPRCKALVYFWTNSGQMAGFLLGAGSAL